MSKHGEVKDFVILVLCVLVAVQFIFLLAHKPKKKPVKKTTAAVSVKTAPSAPKGSIAIVIDDWGYNLNNIHIVDDMNFHFTAAILPNLAYSKKAAEYLHLRNVEIILHFPMEPRERFRLEKNTILTTSKNSEIIRILNDDLAAVLYARGASNHQGSAATENARVMTCILQELKKRKLYFLDSYVSAKSVVSKVAGEVGLASLSRDIFLDNQSDPEYIKRQLFKLKTKAHLNGLAIGIGHDRKNTLEVLRDVVPQLQKEGYRFIYLSEALN